MPTLAALLRVRALGELRLATLRCCKAHALEMEFVLSLRRLIWSECSIILRLLSSDYIKDKPSGPRTALKLRSALRGRLVIDLFAVNRIDRHFAVAATTNILLLVLAELVVWQSICLGH